MDFLELIKKRKSVRKYSDKIVDINLVKEILKEAQEAPTACNHQLYKFIIIDNDDIKKDIVKQSGSVDIIGYAPVSIIIMTQVGWNHNKGSYIQSLGAIAYNIQLSITNKGMSSVWMAGLGNTKKIQKILNIPDVYQVLSVISLGYEQENNINTFKPPRYDTKDKIAINNFDFDESLTFPMTIKKDKVIHCWDIDRWSLEQIDNWRGHAIYASSPSKMAYVGRNYIKDYNYEIDFFTNNLKGENILFLLSSTGQYPSGVIDKIPNKDYNIHELSDKYFQFIKARLKSVA
jgi:nitroreductase